MLERLMDCVKLYQKGEDNKYNPNFITKLLNNYRSHEAILRLPNRMFYENELVACGGDEITRAEYWSQLPNKKFPLIFHAVHGSERRDENSPSVYNDYEVDVVVHYVCALMEETLGGHGIEENDIGIVTPFKYQASIIKIALQQKGLHYIAVGTVEIFQGQEKDIIIISTVRSIVYQHNERFHLGFLSHAKRFNVTITRAKSLLIVVGNPKVLQIDPCWREFIEYCQRNRACRGDNFTLSPLSENEIKKLLNDKMETEECEENLLIPDLKIEKIEESSSNISTNFLSVEERFAAAKALGETLNDWW
ncbi:putative helicase mov-10-B.2 [Belonocnema kinseyi]|uniref:putative helicase mov-10-B.2 n=1 Tax=Belonocnema kinseyi TaxID=2817044 RepID=UPI00143DA544|nr:putative helicase mov-10-B.2 [Belonocnema kinseyi]